MADDNLEIVRSLYDCWERRDNAAAFQLYAPDLEFDVGNIWEGVGLGPVYHGHEGVRRWWHDILGAFTDLRFEPVELIGAGEDKVLVAVRGTWVGRASGAPAQGHHYAVWTVRNGKLARLKAVTDRAEAEREAGIAGSTGESGQRT